MKWGDDMDKLIKIRVPESKVKALEFFLGQRGSSIDAELAKSFDMLYEKIVPKEVRSYVDSAKTDTNKPIRTRPAEQNKTAT